MTLRTTWALAVTGAVLAASPRASVAQAAPGSLTLPFGTALSAMAPYGRHLFDEPPVHTDGPYVVIRLVENRLYLLERTRVVWSAPVATGSGFRLEGQSGAWHFSTPRGIFRVERKEKDPVWIRPAWSYIEEGLPVPPIDHPSRRQAGMLGTSALYIGYELAIHGTDNPELVLRADPDARRVSHGCIRLTNEDARTLYHLVDVGTPVLIY